MSESTVHVNVKKIYREYRVCSKPELLAIVMQRLRERSKRVCDVALTPSRLQVATSRLVATTISIKALEQELAMEPDAGKIQKWRPRRKAKQIVKHPRGFVPRGPPSPR